MKDALAALFWIGVIVTFFVVSIANDSSSPDTSSSVADGGTEDCQYSTINDENIRQVVNEQRAVGEEAEFNSALDSYADDRAQESYENDSTGDSPKYGSGTGKGYYAWRDEFGPVFTQESRNGGQPVTAPAFEQYLEIPWTTDEFSNPCELVEVLDENVFGDGAYTNIGVGVVENYIVLAFAKPEAAPAYQQASYSEPSYQEPDYDYDLPDYSYDDYGYGGDLDCADVSYGEAQSSVAAGDPNGFDGDGDGVGCEWNY